MTYLELCRRVKLDSGQSGVIVNVETTPQKGDDANIIRWVADAWREIQGLEKWPFLRSRASFNTVIGQREYTLADMSATNLKSIDRAFGSLTINSTVYWFQFTDWSSFREQFDYYQVQTGMPRFATITGNRSVKFDFIPDQVYTVTFDYYTQPAQLALNTDQPVIDDDDQMVIVYRALMMYAADAGAPDVFQTAAMNYQLALQKLRNTWSESQTMDWVTLV